MSTHSKRVKEDQPLESSGGTSFTLSIDAFKGWTPLSLSPLQRSRVGMMVYFPFYTLKNVNVWKFFTYVFELERDLSPADAEDLLCFLPNRGFVRKKGTVCWPLPQDSKSRFSCRGVCTLMMGGTLLTSATGRQFDSWVFVEIIQMGSRIRGNKCHIVVKSPIFFVISPGLGRPYPCLPPHRLSPGSLLTTPPDP